MPRLSLIPTFARELVLAHPVPRIPEPTMEMDRSDQVEAYANCGRIDGVMAASSLFHSAQVCSVIGSGRTVLDLGCGPATQLAQIAQLNPGVEFVGVELAPRMLENARQHLRRLGITNVQLRTDDITSLETVRSASVDVVISTMTLHHLPGLEQLRSCFYQIKRVLRQGGGIYLADFGRLKSEKSIWDFAHMHEKYLDPVVVRDYEQSLRAAFCLGDYRMLAADELPACVQVLSTFGVPFLIVVRTDGAPVGAGVRAQLHALRQSLSPLFRADLDDLRRFFRMGGMRSDPFR